MRRKLFFILLLPALLHTAHARVKLPPQICDNMVLQQQTEACLWGEAAPNSVLKIASSWKAQASVNVGPDGRWKTHLHTPSASYDPHTITISDKDGVTVVKNVLVGEVWFCSGQSNMEMPLQGFNRSPIDNANITISEAINYPGIRMATIAQKAAMEPQEYAEGVWKESNADNAPEFSAAAYHFALRLNRTMHIPIGIIHCSWGGSRVEGWMPRNMLEDLGEDISMASSTAPGIMYMKPMIMYNGMLSPLVNYTIRGFLWYQGCSNVDHHDTYAERMAMMVDHWRSLWGLGEIPFYYVEIAPYKHDRTETGVNGALLREAQFKAQRIIPNSAMITTNDLVKPYESGQVHPSNKTDIGERLAWLALHKTYNYKGILADYPVFERMEIGGNAVKVFFANAPQGFLLRTGGYYGFEVAGKDKIFHAARATPMMMGGAVMVVSDSVPEPVAVRYCFRNFQVGNLTSSGMPAFPFRSDNW
ncbi:MAG: sialate O-acetylesterase [Tannerellaceae bacterium]|jgi:sialate O-acetylesterase|nr:sialate O-acetylesterase [Tannerellaceae bacterium]